MKTSSPLCQAIYGGDLVEVGIIKRYKKQIVLLCNKISFSKPDDMYGHQR